MSGRRRRGFVLVVVLVFALLLAADVTTFTRRAVVDAMITVHRDQAAQAEALARGGYRVALALLIEDRIVEQTARLRQRAQSGPSSGPGPPGLPIESERDIWAKAGDLEVETGHGGTLRLEIEDLAARLNLNALFSEGAPLENKREQVGRYLEQLLDRVIQEMPGRPEEKLYDPEELAQSLIDYVDADEETVRGEYEDDFYQQQDPPYRAPNRPLLSVAELIRVRGFDAELVDALEPYVTVFPYAGGGGINLNTAPPHVLALLYHHDPGEPDLFELSGEDEVRKVLMARQDDLLICTNPQGNEECVGLEDLQIGGVFPPMSQWSDVFRITAEGRVGDMRRTLEAVVDRTDPAEPVLLSWRMH